MLDVAGAEAVTEAAERAAAQAGHRVVIAVVDAAGDLLQLRRTEGAQTASVEVGIDKAAPPRSSSARAARSRSR
jgi:uncharacterized protein GlcG (DUF336 family)